MVNLLLFFGLLSVSVTASVLAKKLTLAAAVTGGVLAILIYFGIGWTGLALMGVFFLVGTLATSWRKEIKQPLGLVQESGGSRNTGQVLANGGAGGLLGGLAILFPQQSSLLLLLTAAAFSSAAADTVSSELGSVYGRKFYDILSLMKGQRGSDGVVSAEGFLFGLAGSAVIATVYASLEGWNKTYGWLLIAGTLGNAADSYLGAAFERKGLIGNNTVNFLNTVIAALVAWLLVKV